MSSELYKLIIMDDDFSVHKILHQYLSKKFFVKSIYEPEELSQIHLDEYDAILLDYFFKGNKKNGLDLLKEIRNVDFNISVILMTGYSSENLAIEAIRYNIDDYLVKPVNFKRVPDLVIKNIVKNRIRRSNNSKYFIDSEEEIKLFDNLIILKNSIPILTLGSWKDYNEKKDNYEVLIGGFLSAFQNFSSVYFGQSLNELSLNKEKILFYKDLDLVISLRISNDYYSEIESIISKKTILEQMKKIIEFLSFNVTSDENRDVPLDVKKQVKKLVQSSNRLIKKEINKNLFTEIENRENGKGNNHSKSDEIIEH